MIHIIFLWGLDFSWSDPFVWIALVLLLIILGFLFWRKKELSCIEESNQSKPKVDLVAKAKQDAKNLDYVGRLIDGHCLPFSSDKKIELKRKFQEWQKVYSKMFSEDSKYLYLVGRRNYLIEKDKHYYQKFKNTGSSYPPPPTEKDGKQPVLFMKDAFTEPFPASHDMDTWAMRTQVADIFLLNGISIEDSKNYFQHEKEHIVNHEMRYAIILFDLYKYE